jgi:hypothetical protein
MNECRFDSLKCNNTETYIDIHCNVLPSNKTTVTLREANGICWEVHNNNLNDRSAKAGGHGSVRTPVGLNKARTQAITKTPQMLPTTEMTDATDPTYTTVLVTVTENPSTTVNRKLKWFLKIQFNWQFLLSQKWLLYSLWFLLRCDKILTHFISDRQGNN